MPTVSYEQFCSEVLEIYGLKAAGTCGKMRQVLREFGELGLKTTADLKPVIVARWVRAHPGRARATADSLLRSFKSALTVAQASGYLITSPLAVRPELGDETGMIKVRHYSIAEVDRILALATAEAGPLDWKRRRLEALIHTYAFAALRKREALYLQWEDVDFRRNTLSIHPVKSIKHRLKTPRSEALIPMAGALAEVLDRWRPAALCEWVFPGVALRRPWTGGPPGLKPLCQIKALGARAGVQDVTILGFRHSFATHARRWGISREMVQAILRHTTLRTQEVYQHDDLDDLADAISKVGYRAA